jgi:dihydrofolate synthase/folylpolyglutamate synthase
MNYDEAVRYLLTLGKELAAPRQARVQKFDLANISILSESLGSPHRGSPCVHIAGTNGKGSTAAMLDSILRAAGLRTGLYTSPHLERINERIRIAGEDISGAAFAESFTRVETHIEALMASGALAAHPTFFECLTALAYDAFAHAEIDFAVYEVGMGGRLDATNIVTPEVAVITQIDFDHEAYLGHSIEQITGEKAGIIKSGGWVVSSAERPEARAVIARRAAAMDARLVEIDAIFEMAEVHAQDGCYSAVVSPAHSKKKIAVDLRLPGRFQLRNALAAIAAARLLAQRGFPIDDDSIARGLAGARWPGRLERLAEKPALYLDGSHNPAGARELLAFWDGHLRGRKIFLIYGAMRDKAVDEISGLLFPRVDTVILTEPHQSRAISVEVLREMTHHHAQNLEVVSDPVQALERVFELAHPDDVIFVTGSLYLVGDLRKYWLGRALTANAHTLPTR